MTARDGISLKDTFLVKYLNGAEIAAPFLSEEWRLTDVRKT